MFPDAVARWDARAADDALANLETQLATREEDQPLEALVLLASLAGASGQPQRAEALWRTVMDRAIFMRTFARRALVDSLVTRGQVREASTVLNQLTESGDTRHLDLMLSVADGYSATGRTPAARALYGGLIARQSEGAVADRARMGLSASLESDGRLDAAIQQLRETQLRHRSSDVFAGARAAESRIRTILDLPPVPWTTSQYRTLVRRLRRASSHATALTLLDEWEAAHGDGAGPSSAAIAAERIESLYAQRANDAAFAACRQFYERFPDSSLTPDIKLTEFRLAVRVVDTSQARHLGLQLWERRVPGATATHRWHAGNLLSAHLVAVGDVRGGLELYRQLFAVASTADRQREILWRAGVAAMRAGQVDRAVTNFRSLLDRNPTGDLLPAGQYWLAIAEATMSAEQSQRRLRAILQRFPFHYYAMRARQVLSEQGVSIPTSATQSSLTFPDLALSPGTIGRAEYKAAMVLARAGLRDDAAWYLRRLLDRRQSDRALALLAARASASTGDYRSVTRILVNHFGAFLYQPAQRVPTDFWQLVYPRPFWEDIDRWGRTHDVDPLLLTALMRRESRFDPAARSAVGAIGLFQIMPYTADALGQRAGVADALLDGLDDVTLMRPSVNAAIAARLSADLLQLFDGAIAPVVASYNAGEARVAAWWDAARALPETYFVDTIPYSETRRFAREVLTNYAAYQRLYAQ